MCVGCGGGAAAPDGGGDEGLAHCGGPMPPHVWDPEKFEGAPPARTSSSAGWP